MSVTNPSLSVELVLALVRERTGTGLWLDESGARTWRNLGATIEAARHQCQVAGVMPGSVVVVPGETTLESLAWLFAAAAGGAVAAPLRRERRTETGAWKNFVRIDWRVEDGRLVRVGEGALSGHAGRLFRELRARGHPGLMLATGGTTGTPKVVLHDLTTLLATVPVRAGRPRRVLPLMRFDHIGGLDMAWRALAGAQVLVAPPTDYVPEAVAATVARHRVEVMPATPSFLNLLLLAEAGRRHDLSSLRVVPYGAEPMPSGLLSRLRAVFPDVEFVQRFGTSETGALPVRPAGEGIELLAEQAGFSWKVVEDELWVRSPARALGYLSGDTESFAADGWFRTGDLIERLPDGGLRVLGRRQEMINVGGEKVLPGGIESVLLTHPQVADCRVRPVANALLGQVVAAEIVWRGEPRDALAVKSLLHRFAAGSLPKCHLPAVVKLVEAVETTGNMKKLRRSTA